jgi:hypothetical protein
MNKGETKITGTPGPGAELSKRFYISGVIITHCCDACGTINTIDLGEKHVSYATVGEPCNVCTLCTKCDSEIVISIVIDVTVTLKE